MWSSLALVVLSAYPSPPQTINGEHPADAVPKQTRVSGSARSSDSENFCVQSWCACCDARLVAECCESWRKHLQAKWLEAESNNCWNPRCVVTIHARRETYRAAIGDGGDRTFGSSLIDSRDGRISTRRIDLLVDPQGTISALGHELTHVVLADAFPGKSPPAWANEGAAVLADSVEKQQLHRRDLDHSVRHQTVFHCAEILLMSEYPSPNRIAAFYGHSASLVAFLAHIGGPEKFVPFLKQANENGYDYALHKSYGIQGVTNLQHRWNEHAKGAQPQLATANGLANGIKSVP